MSDFDYDVIVIGSGFGGSVTALRLTEKGYRVGVLEAGRRFADDEFAKTSWRLRKYVWAPRLGCYGILRMTLLRNTFITAGAGVGGGSLVFANTLYRPLEPFFRDQQWAGITDWKAELEPYFDQAERMLGAADVPRNTNADDVLLQVAQDIGRADTFHRTRVGVLFGRPGQEPGTEVPDPYFGGVGPSRKTCISCGQCIVGCRHNAKNTTVKNYLYLAEQAGATVHPLTTVTKVRPLKRGGYAVKTIRTGRFRRRTFTAEQVVFSAAALGTQKLLHKLKTTGAMPDISPRLGHLTRTNSEAVLYPRSLRKDADFTQGVSLGSSIHADDITHIEVGRLGGKGSNFFGLTTTVLVDKEDGRPRPVSAVRELARNWRHLYGIHNPRRWAEQTIGVLVMQTTGNSLITYPVKGTFGRLMTSKPGPGDKPPVWIPVAHDVTRRIAEKIGGVPKGSIFDPFNIPSTGHFLGGCPIGDSPDTGVVDAYQRLYGYPGVHVVDGSAISANLGVNPSLTITAQAERAMALWPNKGEADQRPPLGAPYRRLEPVVPHNPVVPQSAPAGLGWAKHEEPKSIPGTTVRRTEMSEPQTLPAAFQQTAAAQPDEVALRTPGGGVSYTWSQYADEVRRIAGGLAALGVKRGDTVATMLTNRPEFHLVTTAAEHLGATTYGMYNTSSAEQINYLVGDAATRAVVTERQFADTVRAAGGPVEHVLVVEDGDLDKLQPADGFDFDAAWQAVQPDDVVCLIYTSGTTGPPKGVEQTHASMIGFALGTQEVFDMQPGDVAVSYLPSCHIADRFLSHYAAMLHGVQITSVADLKALPAALAEVRPTIFAAVPRVWEKLKLAVDMQLGANEQLKAGFEAGAPPVLDAVRAKLGLDRARWALTGAAAIAPDVYAFLAKLGIPVSEVWGMSECGVATGAKPDEAKPGTVGRMMGAFEGRIADDGELLVRGPGLMRGYRNAPEKTAEAIDADGWLHTGDVVTVDEDGFYKIVDRKKELIINAGGKNMSPSNIENAIASASPLIGSVMAVGDGKPYNVGLITLDPDAAAATAAKLGIVADPAVLVKDERVRQMVQAGVDAGNERLSRVEQIKRFALLPTYWEPGGDELTPTMKIKRKPTVQKYAAQIDELYATAAV